MGQTKIDHLIINSPYEEPKYHWHYDRESRSFEKREGRRPAGYVVATPDSKAFDDPGIFVALPLVNQIRPRVKAWRENEYPGVTGITKRLLEHWHDRDQRQYPFFFCELEAIETLVWLVEAPASEKVGIDIPKDGGEFTRLCSKMATGSGKTVVMAMLIAWQVLNKLTYPQDARFSKYVLVIAPGLTVKTRLQVLQPFGKGNYYDEFNIVPAGLIEKLRQGKIIIHNWHKLSWETEEQVAKKRSVDKRGVKSTEAYVREVLGDMAKAKNIIVINDEAHHAWRVNIEAVGKYLRMRDMKDSAEEATVWVGGLDRIHKARGILNCFDFSATPFAPSGKKSSEETLFGWVVSDFGLNDAIESGLVKTPRVVVRDDALPDARTYKSKLYHIYQDPDVKDDVNRKAEAHEPLPDLVINGYYLLGIDWLKTAEKWRETKYLCTPPVMITVANTTHTAARIKYAFDHKKVRIDELCIPERILHIDSKVLEMAEAQDEPIPLSGDYDEETEEAEEPKKKLTRKQLAEQLREIVDTVGKRGKPGEQIQKVISVGMLSEGWDAKTVTHIMGLRAFTSQLLCEQVVGRGLRRTSYDMQPGSDMFAPEYVNIFGVPFTFLPHESQEDGPPPPPTPKTAVEPVAEKKEFEISWPNVIRIDRVYRPKLTLNWEQVEPLELNAFETAQIAELAPIVDGKPDVTKISQIDLERLGREQRMQRIIFEVARDNYDQIQKNWKGNKQYLLAQLIRIVEQFISANKVRISPSLFHQDELRRRVIITLNMNKVVQHIADAIRHDNVETLEPVFDRDNPIRSTGDMRTWYTGKPCEYTRKSHINFCVFDSTWEATEAFQLDHNENVAAWAKNDHLGLEVLYTFKGIVKKYRPDFIIGLKTGNFLVLETKGQDTQKDKTKRAFLDEWVRAVNEKGGFGKWLWAVSHDVSDLPEILQDHATK
ncbi:MAG TPA: DEAD/DEAH box helicase family protein [Sedimentisphaerales bacterium]|nr:DEAD/DEAH box helicase family protein [Sedimentisphaerales bacterium]